MSMAAYGLGIVLAPVLGPTLGGWLTDTFSWRYAFYINIPFGMLAIYMIARFVHDPPYIKNAKVGPFDNIGFGLLMLWTGSLQIVLDKGQEDDWFGAVWVRWAVLLLIVSLGLWIWRSWTNREGLLDLHVLKDRNFRTGCILIAMLGMCIYITIAILPLYYQEILGYTAFTAGLVVGPRGIGSFIGSPIIGILGSRIDNRKLMTSTIPNKEMGNATGLANMLRNIGGSIGIAMATTALIRRADLHQTELGGHITASTWVYQQKSAALAGYIGHHLGPAQGRPGAMGLLYGLMEQQAALMAYVDVFRWTAVLAFICAAATWMFKKPVGHAAPPPGAH
jgi:DHA2 family multidrug resistance protein